MSNKYLQVIKKICSEFDVKISKKMSHTKHEVSFEISFEDFQNKFINDYSDYIIDEIDDKLNFVLLKEGIFKVFATLYDRNDDINFYGKKQRLYNFTLNSENLQKAILTVEFEPIMGIINNFWFFENIKDFAEKLFEEEYYENYSSMFHLQSNILQFNTIIYIKELNLFLTNDNLKDCPEADQLIQSFRKIHNEYKIDKANLVNKYESHTLYKRVVIS